MDINMHSAAKPAPDLTAVKSKQQAAWSSGDYAIVGTTLQIVGESLCEAVDLRSNQRVLDVAAGNGNATLAAARRFAKVVSTDYVGALLARGRERAEAERLDVTFREADAEDLPFADASFDVVLSTFGVMFTPNQEQAASELMRVCKRGGKIGLASWTPESFIGRLFKTIGRHVPPAPGVKSPALWGSLAHLDGLLGRSGSIRADSRTFVMRYRSPDHWLEVFRTFYGPVLKAFAALDANGQANLEADIRELMADCNTARDGTAVIPSEYLEVVVTKAA
jgi:SAM-dependent methyltransferase